MCLVFNLFNFSSKLLVAILESRSSRESFSESSLISFLNCCLRQPEACLGCEASGICDIVLYDGKYCSLSMWYSDHLKQEVSHRCFCT